MLYDCINIVDCIYIVCIIDCIKFAAIVTVGTVCARREGEFIYYIIYINPPPRPVHRVLRYKQFERAYYNSFADFFTTVE